MTHCAKCPDKDREPGLNSLAYYEICPGYSSESRVRELEARIAELEDEKWRLVSLLDKRNHEWQRQQSRVRELEATLRQCVGALKQSHDCATLRDDGTCDGCLVSATLAAVQKALEGE